MTMQEKWLLASKGLLESEKKIVGNQYFSVIIEQPHIWVLTMYGDFFFFKFKLNYISKMRGYPDCLFGFQPALIKVGFFCIVANCIKIPLY